MNRGSVFGDRGSQDHRQRFFLSPFRGLGCYAFATDGLRREVHFFAAWQLSCPPRESRRSLHPASYRCHMTIHAVSPQRSHQAEACGDCVDGLRGFAPRAGRWVVLDSRGIGEGIARGSMMDGFDFERFKMKGAELQFADCRSGLNFIANEIRDSFSPPRHGDVDILKNLAGGDAEDAFGRLDQVVALTAAMLASEVIGEAEGVIEFLGFHQEAGAVGLPFNRSHGASVQIPVVLLR